MKKILTAMCAAFVAVAMSVAFSACTSEADEAHTHTMTAVAAVQATCTEEGNTAYYVCSECGKYYSDEEGENEISLSDTVIVATGHSMNAVAATAATCTEAGNIAYYECENCGEYFSDAVGTTQTTLADTVIAATGHDLVLTEAISATCTEGGNIAYYECATCGKYFSDEDATTEIELSETVVPATGHSTVLIATTAATCTEDGNIAYYECENCGTYFSDAAGTTEIAISDTVIAATGHSLTLVEAKAPTCTEDGNIEYYVCENCGTYFADETAETEIALADTVIAASHSLTLVSAEAATCTEAGNIAYYVCENCGKYFSDEAAATEIELSDTVVPATGHNTALVVATDATCTEDGNIAYYVCVNCGTYFSDEEATMEIELSDTVVPATGHSTKLVEATAATCTEDGNIAYYVCENCGTYFSDAAATTEIELSDTVIPATGHSTVMVNSKQPTCTEDGNITYYVCENCGKYFANRTAATEISLADTVIAATGHDLILVEANEPTCTEDGNIEYYECENCGTYFADEAAAEEIAIADTVLPATGHNLSLVTADDGTQYYECEYCGKHFADEDGNIEIESSSESAEVTE